MPLGAELQENGHANRRSPGGSPTSRPRSPRLPLIVTPSPPFRFTGRMFLTAVEAAGLPERVPMPGGLVLTSVDPYLEISVDGYAIGATSHNVKTFDPKWKEVIESCVRDAETMEFTIYHKSTVPPDKFVANGKVSMEELIKVESDDVWVRCNVC